MIDVTKHFKAQGKILPGRATASPSASRAPYQHRENPKCKHSLGNYQEHLTHYSLAVSVMHRCGLEAKLIISAFLYAIILFLLS